MESLLPMAIRLPHRAPSILLVPVAISALILASCQGAKAARCRADADLSSTLTPVQLSLDTAACVQRGAWTRASLLFGLAKTYALTDAVRLEAMAGAAPQGWPGPMLPALILRDRLDPAQVRRLQEEIRALAENPARHRQLCSLLRRVGPPSYSPLYRVDDRWQVSAPPQGDAPKAKAVTKAAWERVLSKQVDCSPAG